jgi:creatinine amidohydrolase
MDLTETAWPDAEAVDTDLAVLPIGSTEQHGPHAPLGTDHLAAAAVAEAGVDAFDGEAVLAPAIPVGVAEEHRDFPGTLWVSEDTFRAYVRETVQSLASHGWDRAVIVNGHGGNVAPLRETCTRLTRDGDAYTVAFTWFDAIEEFPEGVEMGHGGPVETSLLQHIHPERVDESRFAEAREDGADAWGEWQSGTNLAYDTSEFSASGTVGDPGAGSEDLGEQLLTEASENLAALLETVEKRDLEE